MVAGRVRTIDTLTASGKFIMARARRLSREKMSDMAFTILHSWLAMLGLLDKGGSE